IDSGDLAWRTVRVETIDEVVAGGPLQQVVAVIPHDPRGERHGSCSASQAGLVVPYAIIPPPGAMTCTNQRARQQNGAVIPPNGKAPGRSSRDGRELREIHARAVAQAWTRGAP